MKRADILLPRIEISPPKTSRGTETLSGHLATLPPGFQIEIVFSPLDQDPVSNILRATSTIQRAGHKPIPHISARGLKYGELGPFLENLSDQGVREVLVIGGDPNPPKGPYHESMQVLAEIVAHNRNTPNPITRVGVAGHPDGHPQATIVDVRHKVNFLNDHGIEPHIQTQPVARGETLISYARNIAESGIDAPIMAGLFGPGTAVDYLQIASQVGVRKSTLFLWRNPQVLAAALLETARTVPSKSLQEKIDKIKGRFNYGPENLIQEIASHPELADTSIQGIYLFSLKNFGKSARFYLQNTQG